MIPIVTGQVYKLTEIVDVEYYHYDKRSFVARFLGTKDEDSHDTRHLFKAADGRLASLRIEDWEVEEGSELVWVLG